METENFFSITEAILCFSSKHQDTAKLGLQRITVKSSKVDQPPLLAESSIAPKLDSEEVSEQLLQVGWISFYHGDSSFRPDEQPELDLENDYLNKIGYNLKTNCSISILYKDSDGA